METISLFMGLGVAIFIAMLGVVKLVVSIFIYAFTWVDNKVDYFIEDILTGDKHE